MRTEKEAKVTRTFTRRIVLVALAAAALFLAVNWGDIREVGFAWLLAAASIFIAGYLGALVVLVVSILVFGWIILGDVGRVIAVADEMGRARADSGLPRSGRNGIEVWTAAVVARGLRLTAPLRRRTFERMCQCGATLRGKATPEDEDAEFSRWWRQGHDGPGHGPWIDDPVRYGALAAERLRRLRKLGLPVGASPVETRPTPAPSTTETTASAPSSARLPSAAEVARRLANALTRPLTPAEQAEVLRRREVREREGREWVTHGQSRSRLIFPVSEPDEFALQRRDLRVSLYGDSRRIPLPSDIQQTEDDWEDPVGEVLSRRIRPVLAKFERAGRTFRTMVLLEGVVVDADMPSRMPITEVRISPEPPIEQADWDQLVAAVRAEVDTFTRRTGLAAVVADMTPSGDSPEDQSV